MPKDDENIHIYIITLYELYLNSDTGFMHSKGQRSKERPARKGGEMKIEKINENQIRCTLTAADLEERKIRLSELAYGSEKARSLFRDMMMEAYRQFGFMADNIPLMIEAVPMSSEKRAVFSEI